MSQNQTPLARNFMARLKPLSVSLSIILLAESALIPLAQASIFSPRASQPIEIQSSVYPSDIQRKPLHQTSLVRPSVGSLVDENMSGNGRIITHVQDIHDHIPAQMNISVIVADAVDQSKNQNKSLLVAVEGVSGKIDLHDLRNVADTDQRKDISQLLLEAGILFGEEAVALGRDSEDVILVGLESAPLYTNNVLAKENTRVTRKQIQLALKKLQTRLLIMRDHNYGKKMREFDRARSRALSGEISLFDYVNFLNKNYGEVISQYPKMAQVAKLGHEQTTLDIQKIRHEAREAVNRLMATHQTSEKISQLTRQAKLVEEGKLDPAVYYQSLAELSPSEAPHLNRYAQWLNESKSSIKDDVISDLEKIEDAIARQLLPHPISFNLYRQLSRIDLLEKYVSLTLIPEEWARVQKLSTQIVLNQLNEANQFINGQMVDLGYGWKNVPISQPIIARALKGSHGFYSAANGRDRAMIDNLEKVLGEYPEEKFDVLLIAGGFHTAGLTYQLKLRDLNYRVIRPHVESVQSIQPNNPYLSLMPDAKALVDRAALGQFLRRPGLTSTLPGQSMVANVLKPRSGSLTQRMVPLLIWSAIVVLVLSFGTDTGWSAEITNHGNGISYLPEGAEAAHDAVQRGKKLVPIIAFILFGLLLSPLIFILLRVNIHRWQKARREKAEQIEHKERPAGRNRTNPVFIFAAIILPLAILFNKVDWGFLSPSLGAVGVVLFSLLGVVLFNGDAQSTNEKLFQVDRSKFLSDFSTQDQYRIRSAEVMHFLISHNLLDTEKYAQAIDVASALDRELVVVGAEQLFNFEWDDTFVYVPARFLNINMGSRLVTESGELNLEINWPDDAKERWNAWQADIREAKEKGIPLSQLHDEKVDEFYMSRFLEIVTNPKFENWFFEKNPNLEEEGKSLLELVGEWFNVSNLYKEKLHRVFIENKGAESGEYSEQDLANLKWAHEKTENLAKVARLAAAIPRSYDPSDKDAVDPYSLDTWINNSENQNRIANNQMARDQFLFLGKAVYRWFAAGAWTRGGFSKAAALVTPRDLAKEDKLDLRGDSFFSDLPFLARYLIQLKSEIQEIARERGWDENVGIASQRIDLAINEENKDEILDYLKSVNYFGFSPLQFTFHIQRVGEGFGVGVIDQKIIKGNPFRGPTKTYPYGHNEVELLYLRNGESFILDKTGNPVHFKASRDRQLTANGKLLFQNMISTHHIMRRSWIRRPEILEYMFQQMIEGDWEAMIQMHTNVSGDKGGYLPGKKGLDQESRDWLGLPKDDRKDAIFLEGNNVKRSDETVFKQRVASKWVNSGLGIYNPRALEKRINPFNGFTPTYDVRPFKVTFVTDELDENGKKKKIDYTFGGTIIPDGASYFTVFNRTNAKEYSPSEKEKIDGRVDAHRFENKTKSQWQKSIDMAIDQDDENNNPIYYQNAKEVMELQNAAQQSQSITALGLGTLGVLLAAVGVNIFDASSLVGSLLTLLGGLSLVISIIGSHVEALSGIPVELRTDYSSGPEVDEQVLQSANKLAAVMGFSLEWKNGILGEADETTRSISLGTGLLSLQWKAPLFIKKLILYAVIAHEYAHLTWSPFKADSPLRILNEAVAYPLGLLGISVAYYMDSYGERRPELSPVGFEGKAVAQKFSDIGRNESHFTEGWESVQKDADVSDASFVYVSLNSIQSKYPNNADVQLANSLQLIDEMTKRRANADPVQANIIVYGADKALFDQVAQNVNPQFFNLFFAQTGSAVMSSKDLAEQANVPSSLLRSGLNGNAYVLTFDPSDGLVDASDYVLLQGAGHLALAGFAYSQYKAPHTVLDQLIQLFTRYTPLELNTSITNEVMSQISALLHA